MKETEYKNVDVVRSELLKDFGEQLEDRRQTKRETLPMTDVFDVEDFNVGLGLEPVAH